MAIALVITSVLCVFMTLGLLLQRDLNADLRREYNKLKDAFEDDLDFQIQKVFDLRAEIEVLQENLAEYEIEFEFGEARAQLLLEEEQRWDLEELR